MSKRPRPFPVEVKTGSVVVKIYRVRNKSRPSFMVSHHAHGKRYQKMFARFADAQADANSKATAMSRGELDVLELRSVDRIAYLHALETLQPTGMALELAVKDYAEAWKVLGGKASLVEAAREFARRHMHELPSKLLPEAVDEMIETRARDGTGKAYMRVLRQRRGQTIVLACAEAFCCPCFLQRCSLLAALLRVPSRSRAAIHPTVSVVSRLNRAAIASLAGSLLRRSRSCASVHPKRSRRGPDY